MHLKIIINVVGKNLILMVFGIRDYSDITPVSEIYCLKLHEITVCVVVEVSVSFLVLGNFMLVVQECEVQIDALLHWHLA